MKDLQKTTLEFDFINELNLEEREYLDQLLYNQFHGKSNSITCEKILKIRSKLNMDIQENFMISDFEYRFNKNFNLNK